MRHVFFVFFLTLILFKSPSEAACFRDEEHFQEAIERGKAQSNCGYLQVTFENPEHQSHTLGIPAVLLSPTKVLGIVPRDVSEFLPNGKLESGLFILHHDVKQVVEQGLIPEYSRHIVSIESCFEFPDLSILRLESSFKFQMPPIQIAENPLDYMGQMVHMFPYDRNLRRIEVINPIHGFSLSEMGRTFDTFWKLNSSGSRWAAFSEENALSAYPQNGSYGAPCFGEDGKLAGFHWGRRGFSPGDYEGDFMDPDGSPELTRESSSFFIPMVSSYARWITTRQ